MSSMCPKEFIDHICYPIPNSEHKLIFTPGVIQTFSKYRQERNDPESGGLLFAEFDLPIIHVIEASTPNKNDKRWRTLFIPNRILQRQLIKQKFKKGYHFIGEWHTHPIAEPSPSSLDLESTADSFLRSRHELNYFVMVIVGNTTNKPELWVSIHNGTNYYRLNAL